MALLGPFNFSKGLDSNRSNLSTREGLISTLKDWNIDSGVISSKRGSFLVKGFGVGTPDGINGLTYWYDNANNKDILVVSWNATLRTAPYTGDSLSTLTWTDRSDAVTGLDGTLTNTKTWDSLNNILVMAGGSGTTQVLAKLTAYNANFANLAGSPPQADIVKVVNNFMFLGKNLSSTTTKSRIYWSNLVDPETWTAANNLDFRKNDGDSITALSSFGQDLIIFKQRSIGRLETTTQLVSGAITLGPLRTVSESVGCAGVQAHDKLPDGSIIFLGNDMNLYVYDGISVRGIGNQYGNGPIKQFLANSLVHSNNITYVIVRYYATREQVYIFGDTATGTTIGMPNGLVYNVMQNNFQQMTGHTVMEVISLPSIRAGATLGWPQVLLAASGSGGVNKSSVFDLDSPSISYSTNDGNNATVNPTFSYEWTLGGDEPKFNPRCVIMACQLTGTTTGITYQFSVNGATVGSLMTIAQADFISGNQRRLVLPIPFVIDASTLNRPMVLKLVFNWNPTTGSLIVGDLYLSDEILT